MKNLYSSFWITLFLLCGISIPAICSAVWYNEQVPAESDIIMMDIGWPWQPSATYYANWNSGFYPKPNKLSFYAGFVTLVPEKDTDKPNDDPQIQQHFRPNSVWSFWGANDQGVPVRFIDVSDNLYIMNEFGGEGLSATVANMGGWSFIKPNKDEKSNRWYTMLARVWQPTGEPQKEGQYAYMGRWIKDIQENQWHLIGYVQLPIPAASFHGNSGFIEPLTNPKAVRPINRRFGYARKNGQWLSTNSITDIKSQYVVINIVPEGDHQYMSMEYSQRPDNVPMKLTGPVISPEGTGKRAVYTAKQPEQPILDKPIIESVKAYTNNRSLSDTTASCNQIAVEWKISDSSSPQLGYIIELYDTPDCSTAPMAVEQKMHPTCTKALISNLKSPVKAVRLTIIDVFDQKTPPQTVSQFQPLPVLEGVSLDKSCLSSGLEYQMYTKQGTHPAEYFNDPIQSPGEVHTWLHLSEIASGTLVRSGVTCGLDTGIREECNARFALKYTGYINVPESGLYKFTSGIDGAYQLTLDNNPIIIRDGQKGTSQHFAFTALKSGWHRFEFVWLVDAISTRNFNLFWEGPNFTPRPVAASDLAYAVPDSMPKLEIHAENTGVGKGKISVQTTPYNHTVKRISLYLGDKVLTSRNNSTLVYDGILPSGINKFYARLVYDDNKTLDSSSVELSVPGGTIDSSWNVRNIGQKDAQIGIYQTKKADTTQSDAFSFFGNGMHSLTQSITGDFTATCRIDSYNGRNGEPVNSNSWIGLSAIENVNQIDWHWGTAYYLIQRAGGALKTSPDNSDLGGSRVSNATIPNKDKPWIRIQRNGNIWSSWVSADGLNWELGTFQYKSAPKTMNVGLFFSSLNQHARAHYYANVSELKIERTALLDFPVPATAANTAGDRFTGIVTARSNPQIFVIRSTGNGLLRTTDNGQTFEKINGQNSSDDSILSVRSVAIDPNNPEIMLRACGRGSIESSSVWKTQDGGKNWNKLDFPGDFDGIGPSALCGEVIQIDLKNPDCCYIGCESKGYFRSLDAGKTWTYLGLSDNRITSVAQWPFEVYFPALGHGQTQLLITTCPDSRMEYLGRGNPITSVNANTSKVFHITGLSSPVTPRFEQDNIGFYNACWDKQLPTINEFAVATSYGYENTSGGMLSLYPISANIEWLRPITALGAAGRGEGKWGRFYTQALDPITLGRLSKSETWGLSWGFQSLVGDIPSGGLIAVSGDILEGEIWHFLFTDGVYISVDGGKTVKKVK